MNDLINDPSLQVAFMAFLGALSALCVPKVFNYLKGVAGKTENKVDDAVVAKLEEIATELFMAKPPAKLVKTTTAEVKTETKAAK